MKQWRWYYWIILAGYCLAVFVLTLGDIVLGFVFGLLPFVALVWYGRLAYIEMTDYLLFKYPEVLSTILRDTHILSRDPFRSFYFDTEVKDPEYLELKNQYSKWIWAQAFSGSVFMAEFIYNVVVTIPK